MRTSLGPPGDDVGVRFKKRDNKKGERSLDGGILHSFKPTLLKGRTIICLEFTKSVYSFTHLKYLSRNRYITDNGVERKVSAEDY